MELNYETAMAGILRAKEKMAEIDDEAKRKKKPLADTVAKLEAWIQTKAQDEGLDTIPTSAGTGYWSTHYKCTVGDQTAFMDYVRETGDLSLVDKRANKTAVKEYVNEHGQPPPGVNFGGYRVFQIRKKTVKDAA